MTENNTSAETRGARKRSVRRDAALKNYQRNAALHTDHDHNRANLNNPRSGKTRPVVATLTGLGALVLVGGVTAAGTILAPAEPAALDTSASPAQLAAASTQLVCPPAPRLPLSTESGTGEDGSGGDLEFSPVSTDASTALNIVAVSDLAGRAPGLTQLTASTEATTADSADTNTRSATELLPSQPEEVQQGEPATSGLDGVPVTAATVLGGTGVTAGDGQAVILTAEPLGGSAPLVGAVSSFSASDGDLRGLATAGCLPAAHQQWVIGASTQIGTTSVLTLTNPTATPATVNLNLYGAAGSIDAPGTTGLTVGPQQSRSFVLGGLAPSEDSVGVEVISSAGQISASIQQYSLSGVTPLGGDTFQASAAPASTGITIPGLTIPEGDNGAAQLHVLAPSGGPATVTVEIRGTNGVVDTQTHNLTEGTQIIGLDGLEPGTYSVALTAEVPITASATVTGTVAAAEGQEMAAYSATTPLGFDQATALPAGSATTTLAFTSAEDTTVTITSFSASGDAGEEQTIEITTGTTATYQPDASAVSAVQISTTGSQVHAAVSVQTGTGISAYPISGSGSATGVTSAGVPVRIGW